MPRIATKPSGRPVTSSAITTPISPSGKSRIDDPNLPEVLQLHHQQGQHQEDHQRDDHEDLLAALGTLLGRAAHLDPVAEAGARHRARRCRRRAQRRRVSGEEPRLDVGQDRQRRHPVAPPDERLFLREDEGGEGAQRHRPPARHRHLQRRQRVERHAVLRPRPRDHVDQVDVVAQLGDRRPRYGGVERRSASARSSGPAAAPGPGRSRSPAGARARSSRNGRGVRRDRTATTSASRSASLRSTSRSGPLRRYWSGQPMGGPISSGLTRTIASGKVVDQEAVERRLQPDARVDVGGHDHDLRRGGRWATRIASGR